MTHEYPHEVRLVRIPEAEKSTIANLMQLYRYDSSAFNKDEMDASGRFSLGSYFDAYWIEPERHPFFINFGDKLVGFALVRQLELGKHSIAEFFVARKYRRQGIGERAAMLLFDAFPGEWHVAQEEGNVPAQHFWRSVIGAYTGDDFLETYSQAQPKGSKQVFRRRLA